MGTWRTSPWRAARILASAPLVAAEDTRVTRRLLNHLDAKPRVLSCNEHNWIRRLSAITDALDAHDVALVTDAGVPGISDPGAGVVAAVADAGYDVVSVPGVSAVPAALSVSGFPADRFVFLGFLPRRRSERTATLAEAASLGQTLVIFEAPHRVRATLADIADALNDPSLAVCRELTKLHEEVWRGAASDALVYFTNAWGVHHRRGAIFARRRGCRHRAGHHRGGRSGGVGAAALGRDAWARGRGRGRGGHRALTPGGICAVGGDGRLGRLSAQPA